MAYQREHYKASEVPPDFSPAQIAWLRKEFQKVQRGTPWLGSAGDTRDFVTASEGADTGTQFADADTAIGARDLYVAPRTYRFAADRAFSSRLIIAQGAKLRPASGKTITILGPIEAGAYQWMD